MTALLQQTSGKVTEGPVACKMHRILLPLLVVCMLATCCKPDVMEQTNKGLALFESSGCRLCHSLKGENMYGPALDSIYNRKLLVIRNGELKTIRAGRKYIIRSIRDPDFEKVMGFESRTMPIPELSPAEIRMILCYLRDQ